MKHVLIGVLLLTSLNLLGQDSWSTLGMVTFDKAFDSDFGMELMTPKYSPVVLSMDGKEIEVEGYFIALNGKQEQNHFMLSKFPQSTCFFVEKQALRLPCRYFSRW